MESDLLKLEYVYCYCENRLMKMENSQDPNQQKLSDRYMCFQW